LARRVRHIQLHERTGALLDFELQRPYPLVARSECPILLDQSLLQAGGIRAGLLELRARVGDFFTRGFEIGYCARRFRLEWVGALRNLTVELAVADRCLAPELRAKCRDLPALDLTLRSTGGIVL